VDVRRVEKHEAYCHTFSKSQLHILKKSAARFMDVLNRSSTLTFENLKDSHTPLFRIEKTLNYANRFVVAVCCSVLQRVEKSTGSAPLRVWSKEVVCCSDSHTPLWCVAEVVCCRSGVLQKWCVAEVVCCRSGVLQKWCVAVILTRLCFQSKKHQGHCRIFPRVSCVVHGCSKSK